jgi:hypothetical protein
MLMGSSVQPTTRMKDVMNRTCTPQSLESTAVGYSEHCLREQSLAPADSLNTGTLIIFAAMLTWPKFTLPSGLCVGREVIHVLPDTTWKRQMKALSNSANSSGAVSSKYVTPTIESVAAAAAAPESQAGRPAGDDPLQDTPLRNAGGSGSGCMGGWEASGGGIGTHRRRR